MFFLSSLRDLERTQAGLALTSISYSRCQDMQMSFQYRNSWDLLAMQIRAKR